MKALCFHLFQCFNLYDCEDDLFPFLEDKFLDGEIFYLLISVSQLYFYFFMAERLPCFVYAGFEKPNCVRWV